MLLGAQLRRLRETAGIPVEKAGFEIRGSRSKISRLETGRTSFKARDVEDLLTLYGVTGQDERSAILELAQRSSTPEWWTKYGDLLPGWFSTYLGLESSANLIRGFQLQFVPGLFQTEEYARAVTRLGHQTAPPEDIDRRIALRLRRQDLLTRPSPPRIWMILDESVLRRPYGSGRGVMRAQLERLAEASRLPHVTLQAVPFAHGGHAGASGSFSILRFEKRDLPDVVYIEQLTSAVYLDQQTDVQHYREIADQLSSEALLPADTTDFIAEIARDTLGEASHGEQRRSRAAAVAALATAPLPPLWRQRRCRRAGDSGNGIAVASATANHELRALPGRVGAELLLLGQASRMRSSPRSVQLTVVTYPWTPAEPPACRRVLTISARSGPTLSLPSCVRASGSGRR